jgi:hypothetical protein
MFMSVAKSETVWALSHAFCVVSCFVEKEDPGMQDPSPEDQTILDAVPEERFLEWGKAMRGESRILEHALQKKKPAWLAHFEEMKRGIRLLRNRRPGTTQVGGWTDAATASGVYPETISVLSSCIRFNLQILMQWPLPAPFQGLP